MILSTVLSRWALAGVGVTNAGVGLAGGILPRLGDLIPWSWGRSAEVDTSVLEAAPKKRTSHQKKRQRQLAGNNQRKPLRNINRCPSCGHYKRAHTLCMNCVQEIQRVWRAKERQETESQVDKSKIYDSERLSPEDTAFNYPSRVERPSLYSEKLQRRHEYVLSYPRSLVAKPPQKKERQVPLVQRKPYE